MAPSWTACRLEEATYSLLLVHVLHLQTLDAGNRQVPTYPLILLLGCSALTIYRREAASKAGPARANSSPAPVRFL